MAALCCAPSLADTCADAMSGLQEMRKSCSAGPGCCAWAGTSLAAQCCTGLQALTAQASSAQVASSRLASISMDAHRQAASCFPDNEWECP